MGVTVSPTAIRVANTAAVMVTATLPPFAQPGSKIDVTAAAIGDAPNLQGGLLVLTELRGADGRVYAVAQGPVVTGGFVAGRSGTQQTVNHPTVGRVPNGAIVERPAPTPAPGRRLRLQLRQADFTTAARIVEAVNKAFGAAGAPVARGGELRPGRGGSAVRLRRAAGGVRGRSSRTVTVEADRPARVVINERTGTIVMGKDVRIAPVAVMHGSLTVEVQTTYQVSQPAPLGTGTTEVVPQVGVGVKEEKTRNIVLKQGATVEELVRALSAIGSTPRDVIAILQNMRAAGALEAELEVI